MKPTFASAILLSAGLLLGAGCERAQPASEAKPSSVREDKPPSPATDAPAVPAGMVRINAGRFLMGAKGEVDAKPHEIAVSAFFMDATLVTQEQYEKVMGDNPSRWKGAKNPVEQVRWSDAVKFCNKRSELEGLRPCYDLKTWKCDFTA